MSSINLGQKKAKLYGQREIKEKILEVPGKL